MPLIFDLELRPITLPLVLMLVAVSKLYFVVTRYGMFSIEYDKVYPVL